jgi:PhnB protein
MRHVKSDFRFWRLCDGNRPIANGKFRARFSLSETALPVQRWSIHGLCRTAPQSDPELIRMKDFKPDGWPTVVPRLFADDPAALVAFIKATFDATGDLSVGRPTELKLGDSMIMVSDGGDLRGRCPPVYMFMCPMPTQPTIARFLPAPSQSRPLPICCTAIAARWFAIPGEITGRSLLEIAGADRRPTRGALQLRRRTRGHPW